MTFSSVDEIIPFCRRHPGMTIREIIRYDSGYLKDLFINDDRVCFSDECFSDICRLTSGHKDNWEKPSHSTMSIFSQLKSYATPYLYDFNDPRLVAINNSRNNK